MEWEIFMHVSRCLHVWENYVLQFSLITSSKRKQKISEHFVDIAKDTACEKIQRKEALIELDFLEVFFSLNKFPKFL